MSTYRPNLHTTNPFTRTVGIQCLNKQNCVRKDSERDCSDVLQGLG